MNKPDAKKIKQASFEKFKELLKDNPNILVDYPELFETLTFNEKRDDNVASLVERQVVTLKQTLAKNNQDTLHLINNAKHNEFITSRLFEITYELTACADISDIFDVLYQDLIPAFSIDAVGIRLTLDIPSQKELSELDHTLLKSSEYQKIIDSFQEGNSQFGSHFSPETLSLFFGPHAKETLSVAFVPLIMPHTSECMGILGLAAFNEEKFSTHSNSGTLHLDRLGKIVAIAIERATRDLIQVNV